MAETISGADATIAIGTTAAATDQAGFEADSYTAIEQVASFGPIGDGRNEVSYNLLSEGRVQISKGSKRAQPVQVRFAHDPSAPTGQGALRTAEAAGQGADVYNFRVQFDDAITPSTGDPTTIYFRGRVMDIVVQEVSSEGTIERVANIQPVSDFIEVAAT